MSEREKREGGREGGRGRERERGREGERRESRGSHLLVSWEGVELQTFYLHREKITHKEKRLGWTENRSEEGH